MAEIGAIAGVIGIVTAGEKLSIVLIKFASTIGSAAKDIENIGTDISNVCLVLKRVESTLRKSCRTARYSITALADIQRITARCQVVFDEIQDIVDDLKKGKAELDIRSRLKWTIKRSKVQNLRNELEMSKTTLTLMLTTLLVSNGVSSPSKEDVESQRISIQNLIVAQQHAISELEFLEDSESLQNLGLELLPVVEHIEGPPRATPEKNLPTRHSKVMDRDSLPLQLLLPEEIHKRRPSALLDKVIKGDPPEKPRLRRVDTFSNLYTQAQGTHLLTNIDGQGVRLGNLITKEGADGAEDYSNKDHSDGEEHKANFQTVSLVDTSRDMTEDLNLRTSTADCNLNPILENRLRHGLKSKSPLTRIFNGEQDHVACPDRSESGFEIIITYRKPLRVLTDDSYSTIIQIALREYKIRDHWLQYRLVLIYQGQERTLGVHEPPLPIYNQLKNVGKEPNFVLRKACDLSIQLSKSAKRQDL